MTPNPQNIGAAPEGFALEVGKTYETADGYQAKCFLDDGDDELPVKVEWLTGPLAGKKLWAHRNGAHWKAVHPQFNLIREAPSPDAVGVPEPSPAKGPSEVTQPGEGVEDGVGAELADYFERLGVREERQAWVNTLYPEKLRLLAMTLGQRALRRESK